MASRLVACWAVPEIGGYAVTTPRCALLRGHEGPHSWEGAPSMSLMRGVEDRLDKVIDLMAQQQRLIQQLAEAQRELVEALAAEDELTFKP